LRFHIGISNVYWRKRGITFGYWLIKRIPLHRFAAGFADGFDHFGAGLGLGGSGAGHVKNVFFEDGAVEVVGAVAQRDLREFGAEADPVSGDVVEVVEVKAADGDRAEGIEAGGRIFYRDFVVAGLVCEGDEAAEAVGFVLEGAELAEVIDAVFKRFDVAVEHRAGAAFAEFVPRAMNIEVFGGGFLAFGDGGTDGGIENFSAAASEGVEAGFAEFDECVANGFFSEPG
jgi:hypothetical protein